jgi:ariadne-1
MSSDYEYSDEDVDYYDDEEDMMDTQEDEGASAGGLPNCT